jgi:hypothetical protein
MPNGSATNRRTVFSEDRLNFWPYPSLAADQTSQLTKLNKWSRSISARKPNTIPVRVFSGGQTGVDRAALDAALEHGLEIGGWCPRGRRAEDGAVPDHYPLQETAARSYAVRTEWNVRDTDGTLILVLNEISSGTRLTADAAKSHGKPLKIEYLSASDGPGLLTAENSPEEQAESVVEWLVRHKIRTLNVAGPRGSSSKEVYLRAREFMMLVLETLQRQISAASEPVPSSRRRK